MHSYSIEKEDGEYTRGKYNIEIFLTRCAVLCYICPICFHTVSVSGSNLGFFFSPDDAIPEG